MLMAGLGLLMGMWAGLQRLGWVLPTFNDALAGLHGALMMSGFLGALISLERAVALNGLYPAMRWVYLAPALAGLGGVLLIVGTPNIIGISLILAGSVGLVCIFGVIVKKQPSLDHILMGVGALLWLMGNGLWWLGMPIYKIAPWWVAFLLFTIAGERLELGRAFLLQPMPRRLLAFILSIYALGLCISLWQFELGLQIVGVAIFSTGLWMLRFDVARRTIHKHGLTRFIAACLLMGHVWLVVAGALWLVFAAQFTAGFAYDAMLHSLLVGFVFSMIFGHAPVIVPGVLGKSFAYSSVFYVPLVVLHLSLVLRLIASAQFDPILRMWAGLINELAIVMYVALTVVQLTKQRAA
jgi:hypothetical protein